MKLIEHAYLVGAVLVLFLVSLAQGTTESTVYSFGAPGSGDGMYPFCNLLFDAKGNLYGTTVQGGTYGAGIVFELSRGENAKWIETVLYEFTGHNDGGEPFAGLVFDSEGNLYGTGSSGGVNGTGVVFELSPQGGSWTYNVLYSFGPYPDSGDGVGPNSTLVFDKQHNLYGTTSEGGNAGCFQGCGIVFELSPITGGGWKEQVIHAFETNGTDGELPTGGVIVGSDGDLYGTTQNGGTAGSGVLYQLKYSLSKKEWIESLVHQFIGGSDGSFPINVVLIEDRGSLYGTTEGGGANSQGTVFQTQFSKKTGWQTTILYSFGPQYSGNGMLPEAGVTMDRKGNLYGTTFYGGAYYYYGTVFKLSKSKNDKWAGTVLYSFTGGADGFYPEARITIENGWLYGTTTNGGDGSGVVFQNRPFS